MAAILNSTNELLETIFRPALSPEDVEELSSDSKRIRRMAKKSLYRHIVIDADDENSIAVLLLIICRPRLALQIRSFQLQPLSKVLPWVHIVEHSLIRQWCVECFALWDQMRTLSESLVFTDEIPPVAMHMVLVALVLTVLLRCMRFLRSFRKHFWSAPEVDLEQTQDVNLVQMDLKGERLRKLLVQMDLEGKNLLKHLWHDFMKYREANAVKEIYDSRPFPLGSITATARILSMWYSPKELEFLSNTPNSPFSAVWKINEDDDPSTISFKMDKKDDEHNNDGHMLHAVKRFTFFAFGLPTCTYTLGLPSWIAKLRVLDVYHTMDRALPVLCVPNLRVLKICKLGSMKMDFGTDAKGFYHHRRPRERTVRNWSPARSSIPWSPPATTNRHPAFSIANLMGRSRACPHSLHLKLKCSSSNEYGFDFSNEFQFDSYSKALSFVMDTLEHFLLLTAEDEYGRCITGTINPTPIEGQVSFQQPTTPTREPIQFWCCQGPLGAETNAEDIKNCRSFLLPYGLCLHEIIYQGSLNEAPMKVYIESMEVGKTSLYCERWQSWNPDSGNNLIGKLEVPWKEVREKCADKEWLEEMRNIDSVL